jgi:hypothetical protein
VLRLLRIGLGPVAIRHRIADRLGVLTNEAKSMLNAAQRQRKLAKRAKVRKEKSRIAKSGLTRDADCRGPDDWLLIFDKREELFGQGHLYMGYTAKQINEVNAIIDGYTHEQREVAIKLAKALRWETPEEDCIMDVDHFELRQQQRREQGRGI